MQSGSVLDADRKPLGGWYRGRRGGAVDKDGVLGTPQAPNKCSMVAKEGALSLPFLRFQQPFHSPAPDQETPWAAF